jgi:hypothetical protein
MVKLLDRMIGFLIRVAYHLVQCPAANFVFLNFHEHQQNLLSDVVLCSSNYVYFSCSPILCLKLRIRLYRIKYPYHELSEGLVQRIAPQII